MTNIKKLAQSGILIALGVICSTLSIPLGIAKVYPVQHFINVLAGATLGPAYAVSIAFITSLIRISVGTGTMLAFPGSMCGAFLSGLLYKYTKRVSMAYIGEIFGTGIIGAVLAYPVATFIMSRDAALFGFIIPFGVSSVAGATISTIFIVLFNRLKINAS